MIKAEAYARMATPDLANVVLELNKVITKKPSEDPFGIGADQPPYSGPLTQAAILDEIYRQRCIELFMSALKLEDMRRFGRPMQNARETFFHILFVKETITRIHRPIHRFKI